MSPPVIACITRMLISQIELIIDIDGFVRMHRIAEAPTRLYLWRMLRFAPKCSIIILIAVVRQQLPSCVEKGVSENQWRQV